MNSRGVSPIVASVLILLLSIAAVAVLWGGVIPMVNKASDVSESGRIEVLSSGGYTVCDSSQDVASVQVKQTQGEEISRMKIILDFEGNSYSEEVDSPGSGNTKTYYFDVSSFGACPEFVSVLPIYRRGAVSSYSSTRIPIPEKKIIIRPDSDKLIKIEPDCEPEETRQCGKDVGECEFGVQTCNSEGEWGACTGGVEPEAEICDNNKDDDCDGDTDYEDDDCPLSCTGNRRIGDIDGNGAIESKDLDILVGLVSGSYSLNGDDCCADLNSDDVLNSLDLTLLSQFVSGGSSCFPAGYSCLIIEECGNGNDDDCDGDVDGDDSDCMCVPEETRVCGTGVGECDEGVQTCDILGVWGPCLGSTDPVPEICGDGLDNDCDGYTDGDDADCPV